MTAHHAPAPPPSGSSAAALAALLTADRPLTWVTAGDSVAQGARWTAGERDYAQILEERVRYELARHRDVFARTAVSGWRARDVADTLARITRLAPDVVSLGVGLNDAKLGPDHLADFSRTLREVIARLRSAGALVLLQLPNPVRPDAPPEQIAPLPDFVEAMREAGQATGSVVVDHYTPWLRAGDGWAPARWMGDSTHPNGRGHRVMAGAILRAAGAWDDASECCALGTAATPRPVPASRDQKGPPVTTRRYAVCGLSNRGLAAFVHPLMGLTGGRLDGVLGYGGAGDDLSGHGTVVALVDSDRQRVEEFNGQLRAAGVGELPFHSPDGFDRMLGELAPDAVIVASPDHTHEAYIVAALARGVDVITEKPMVSTAAAARSVLRAESASSARVKVTHNLRYARTHRVIKRMILDGSIGSVTRVTLDYHVDLRHGASYFSRWNRQRAHGGLAVHKCCHHFDLVSWLVGQEPLEIFGYGALNYYGPRSPHRPQQATASGQPEPDPYLRELRATGQLTDDGGQEPRTGLFGLHYAEQYPADRPMYIYDDEIDIEDTYSAVVSYAGGASLAYSIDFSSTWEGYRLGISGTHGSIEMLHGRGLDGEPLPGSDTVVLAPLFGERSTVHVDAPRGEHAGADPEMRRDLFVEQSAESRELGLAASSLEGAWAVALGEGLWRSVVEHRPVGVKELLD
ncbi:Gfo/Idh/MocA family oxidoreductase [Streptomyces sp. NBC_00669]|uniref:GDSL-type esterase/lipase family protein n=1 Tax=Streptomyces sp. NBC_00669 TaxID=2976011 RepID=UPI002E32A8E8|nr:GDSL-type esterase/lipase family protein [Streptomyces sp. NBC_00669]